MTHRRDTPTHSEGRAQGSTTSHGVFIGDNAVHRALSVPSAAGMHLNAWHHRNWLWVFLLMYSSQCTVHSVLCLTAMYNMYVCVGVCVCVSVRMCVWWGVVETFQMYVVSISGFTLAWVCVCVCVCLYFGPWVNCTPDCVSVSRVAIWQNGEGVQIRD